MRKRSITPTHPLPSLPIQIPYTLNIPPIQIARSPQHLRPPKRYIHQHQTHTHRHHRVQPKPLRIIRIRVRTRACMIGPIPGRTIRHARAPVPAHRQIARLLRALPDR